MRDFEARNRHFDRMVGNPGLMWLGQNTNHFPADSSVREALLGAIGGEEYHAYAPPLGFEALRSGIVAELGLHGQSALVTDGAVAGLYHVCHTLLSPGDVFLTTDPTWAWPMAFARAVGAEVVQIPIYGTEHGYRLAPQRLAAAITPRTRMIYLVDPNNPIGTCATAEEISAIAEIARTAGATLVHDCTYRDFAYDHTLAGHHYPEGTITVWSFSKWLGFAGLRIGGLVADADLIERLAQAPPNILGSSLVAQRGAIAGLRAKSSWFPTVLAEQRANQALVRDVVAGIEGLELPVFPSNGNFLVIECDKAGVRPEAVCAVLARRNILVRQGSYHTRAFGDRFIKVSVSVPRPWVEAFCNALPEAIEDARGLNELPQLF